jgi:Fic-DOC domain mobile mystery protein B
MYGDALKRTGTFRTFENYLGIKNYLIAIELNLLLDDDVFWKENSVYNPEELAIQFKHRLVSIHCFANGNGRHSRLMADLIMEKLYNSNFFYWGSGNLVKANETRSNYIQADIKADNNDIEHLIFFAKS